MKVRLQNLGAMSDFEISVSDKKWLRDHLPGMSFEKEIGIDVIKGKLLIDMVYLGEGKPYIINPDSNNLPSGERIQDEFEIKILMERSGFSSLPQVFETGGRIEKTAQKLGFQFADMHFNPGTNAACLCVWTEENKKLPNGYNIEEFFNQLVIPFFYAQSYFEKYVAWPWGQYSHSELGLLEKYSIQNNPNKAETKELIEYLKGYKSWGYVKKQLESRSGVKGHFKCLCGENVRYRNCHKEVLQGMWKLHANIKKFGLEL